MMRGYTQRLEEVRLELGLLRALFELVHARSPDLGMERGSQERLAAQLDRLVASARRAEEQYELLRGCDEDAWRRAANDLDRLLTKLEGGLSNTRGVLRRVGRAMVRDENKVTGSPQRAAQV